MDEFIKFTKSKAVILARKVAERALNKPPVNAKFLGRGSFGAVVRLDFADGLTVAVKLYQTKNVFSTEARDLRLLKQHCPIKVPEVLFESAADAEVPFDCVGMEYIDGKDAFTSPRVYFHSKKRRAQFAKEVVLGLGGLHETQNDRFGDYDNPNISDWIAYYRDCAEKILVDARQCVSEKQLSASILREMERAYVAFDRIFSEKVERATLIHGDLNTMNVLVNPKTLQIKAFIDPLNMRWADRDYEIFQLFNLSGNYFGLYEMYKKTYPTCRYFDAKCAFYAFFAEVALYMRTNVMLHGIMIPLRRRMKEKLRKLKLD